MMVACVNDHIQYTLDTIVLLYITGYIKYKYHDLYPGIINFV